MFAGNKFNKMTLPTFVEVLKTTNSAVNKKTLYKSRFTYFVPDLFFITFYMSLFFFTGILDIFFIFLLFLHDQKEVPGAIFLLTVIFPGIFDFILDSHAKDCPLNLKINSAFRFLLSILGFNAVFNSSRVCAEIIANAEQGLVKPAICFTYSFFQMQSKSISSIKIHCLINSALKSLPRLFILPIFILHYGFEDIFATLGIILIMMSMVYFSFTIAVTFPIRSTPRVFTSSFCVLLNAFSKFMATMSSCGLILGVFTAAFKSIRFHAFLIPLVKCITWSWPCWNSLNSQPVPLNKFWFIIYFILFTFFFSFIYIHPFEGIGKLHYYVFYLFDFLEEILVIYILTDIPLECITNFLCFRIVSIGFLSTFGLVNILHKYKEKRMNYMSVDSSGTARSAGYLDANQTKGGKEIQGMQVKENTEKKVIEKESISGKGKNHNSFRKKTNSENKATISQKESHKLSQKESQKLSKRESQKLSQKESQKLSQKESDKSSQKKT